MPGPIEFLSDRRSQTTAVTVFGGADGLIQPAPHETIPSEGNAAIVRAGMTDVDSTGDVIDPYTGLTVPPDLNVGG